MGSSTNDSRSPRSPPYSPEFSPDFDRTNRRNNSRINDSSAVNATFGSTTSSTPGRSNVSSQRNAVQGHQLNTPTHMRQDSGELHLHEFHEPRSRSYRGGRNESRNNANAPQYMSGDEDEDEEVDVEDDFESTPMPTNSIPQVRRTNYNTGDMRRQQSDRRKSRGNNSRMRRQYSHAIDPSTMPNAQDGNALRRFLAVEQPADDEESMAEMEENREYASVAGLSFGHEGDVMFELPNTPLPQDWIGSMPSRSFSFSPRHMYIPENSVPSHGIPAQSFSFDEKTIMSATETVLETEDECQLRQLAAKLTPEWSGEFMAPTLARRLRDFQFAQEKRRKKYGEDRPWGILGLYEHLTAIRIDVAWAEDAAWRRQNGFAYLAWSAFEDEKNRGFNQPIFTSLLLLVCTGVLVVSIAFNGWSVEPISTNPMIGPSAETLIQLGAKYTDLIVNENQVWRLVTPMFLHAGLIHYIFNMMALWFVGSAVESIHGFIAVSIIFTISAIGGTLMSAIFLPQYISVGASGGIFGLIGSCLADIVINWNLLFSDFVNEGQSKRSHATILVVLFIDIGANTLLGMTPFVDNFTHLGGMLFGFLCGLSTMERLNTDFFGFEQDCKERVKQVMVRFLGVIISVLAIIVGVVVLFQGDGTTSPCPTCNYLSCVPFPPWTPETQKWWYCDDCGNISADAKLNPDTRMFDQLDLNCPGGDIVNVLLGDEATTDKFWLEANLPTYCRLHCNDIMGH